MTTAATAAPAFGPDAARPDILTPFSHETLRYRLGPPRTPPPPPSSQDAAAMAGRILRAWEREQPPAVLLFGLASGAVASALAAALPARVGLLVSESDPELTRSLMDADAIPWWREGEGRAVLTDTSPWAHKLLWLACGLSPGRTLAMINPELATEARGPAQRLREAFGLGETVHILPGTLPPPRLSLGAILSPDEPDLPRFLRQIPAFVDEIVCVWDGRLPERLPPDPRRRDIVRPLAADFAAQRNAMLDACGGDWVLYLDADELLPREVWDILPGLLAAEAAADLAAFAFARLTLYPDEDHAKCGYGLWPDLQARLFRKTPGLRFERPVHERLTGLDGPAAVLLDASILHESALRKSPAQLARKLEGFDLASGGGVRHVQSRDYPRLPLRLLPGTEPPAVPFRALVLPDGRV